MRAPNLFSLGAFAGLVVLVLGSWQRTHRRRLTAKAEPLPAPLQVWEDEGGQNQMAQSPP